MISAVLCALFIPITLAKDKSVVLKIQPDTIVNTFKSLMSSGYLKKIADEFAVKAAEQFMKQIKEEQKRAKGRSGMSVSVLDTPDAKKFVLDPSEQLSLDLSSISKTSYNQVKSKPREPASETVSTEEKVDDEMLELLNSPPPDGDNLEKESLLSDIEEKKVIEPQAHVYKINGKHFRKYDVFW